MDRGAGVESLERRVEAQWRVGNIEAAAEELVRGYGAEVLGFLESTLGDDALAADAFSLFSEDVWRGLGLFRGESSFRTWAYVVARRAASRILRGELLRRQRFTGDEQAAQEVAAQVRTTTARFRQTAAKDQVRALREQLSEDERELLLLRVDRGLDWRDIARIQLGEEVELSELARHAATLRKRFERARTRLRALAVDAGMLQP